MQIQVPSTTLQMNLGAAIAFQWDTPPIRSHSVFASLMALGNDLTSKVVPSFVKWRVTPSQVVV